MELYGRCAQCNQKKKATAKKENERGLVVKKTAK
jgi:hypothetical protein